jgi:hypothetical protein
MRTCFGRYDPHDRLQRHARTCGCALLATSALIMMGCETDHPTSPTGSPTSTNSTAAALAETSSSGNGSQTAHTASAVRTTAAPGTPGNFRISNRSGSVLDLKWEPPSGWSSETGYRFELSYAGKTVRLSYVAAHRHDFNDLDLSPGRAYTLSLRAVNPANQASAPAELVFETTPPDPPTNLRQLSTVPLPSGEYPDQISFSPGGDNSGVVRRYDIILDGRVLDHIGLSGGTTQFSLYRHVFDSYTSVPCGPTALQLRSEDSSFNVGPPSVTLTVFFPEYENCPPPHQDR